MSDLTPSAPDPAIQNVRQRRDQENGDAPEFLAFELGQEDDNEDRNKKYSEQSQGVGKIDDGPCMVKFGARPPVSPLLT